MRIWANEEFETCVRILAVKWNFNFFYTLLMARDTMISNCHFSGDVIKLEIFKLSKQN